MPSTSNESINAAEAVVEHGNRISIIWIVPLVAVLIGGWLIYKAQSEKGPSVVISFVSAEGVVEGKTKVKFKDVDIGEVSSVELGDGLKSVTITALLDKAFEPYLTENTRFWVARPRLRGTQLTGLDTLLSGPYLAISPSDQGKPQRSFTGRENPPVIARDTPGKRLILEADSLDSIEVGSQVYYRRLPAGEVESYKLGPDGRALSIKIFVHHPYDKLVAKDTRFWNASGITASLSANGIQFDTESLSAIIGGGIAFETPSTNPSGNPSAETTVGDSHRFKLYPNRDTALQLASYREETMLLFFDDSIRGLSIGAPVEIRGVKIGEVIDFQLQGNAKDLDFRVPVWIKYQPERIVLKAGVRAEGTDQQVHQLKQLAAKGLRAQLKTGSLLTGQLFVDIDFFPDAPPAEVRIEDGVLVMPTIPGELKILRADLTALLTRMQAIPFEQIGDNLNSTLAGASRLTNAPELTQSLASLEQTLEHSEQITRRINSDTLPELQATLAQAGRDLALLEKNVLREDSPIYHELARTLQELSTAARSIRLMADYLERHPDALIKGKRDTR